MELAGLIYILAAAFVLGPILNGVALSVLWGWFVEPLFGLPPLSVPAAIGIAMISQLLVRIDHDDSHYKDMDLSKIVGTVTGKVVAAPILTIAFAWVVKQFL